MRTSCTCPPNDCAAIVRRVLVGEESASTELHSRFSALVHHCVRRWLGQDRCADWDDACQEIFWRVFVKLDTWRGEGRFCDWIAVVATRHAINIGLRLRNRREEVELGTYDPEGPPAVDPAVRDCFEVTLAQFPEAWQEALRMRSQGATVLETAARLGVSPRTVKTWISVMYSRLQDCLWT